MNIDIIKAIKAPWAKDGGFARMFLGGLVSCIPILNFVTGGYLVEYLDRLINGREELGNIFKNGSASFVIGFKYFVGAILLAVPFVLIELILYMAFAKSAAGLYMLLCNILSFVNSILLILLSINFARNTKILAMVDFQAAFSLINTKDKAINFLILYIMNIVVYIVYIIPIFIIVLFAGLIGALFLKSAAFLAIILFIIAAVIIVALAFAMMVTITNMIGQFAQKSLALQK